MAHYKCPICWKALIRREVMKKGEYYHCYAHGSFAHLGFFHKIDNAGHVGKQIYASRSRIVTSKKGIEKKCSYCLRKMTETLYSEESGILLDQCFKCNHVWFDKDELVKITHPPTAENVSMMSHISAERFMEFQEEEPEYDNPFLVLNLPVEDVKEGPQRLSIITYFITLSAILFTWKGLRDPVYLDRWVFDPSNPYRHYGLTFISSILLHADWLHLFVNAYFLYLVSDNIEDRKGLLFTLKLFLVSGIGASIFYLLIPFGAPTLGASGAVPGMLTYYCFRFPHIKIHQTFRAYRRSILPGMFQYSVSANMFFLTWIATQAFGFIQGDPQINYTAHIGGAFCGFLVFMFDSEESKV